MREEMRRMAEYFSRICLSAVSVRSGQHQYHHISPIESNSGIRSDHQRLSYAP